MGFTLTEFAAVRPFLYHVVARENLPALRSTMTLWSTAALAERSGRNDILGERRRQNVEVVIPEGSVGVRDQAPLSMGSVLFEGGWTAEDLLRELNHRVFLWPGWEWGPIDYGRRHADKYAKTDVLLRLPTRDVLGQSPQFCKYNSGSPRCYQGRKSPRGPETFLPAGRCDFKPTKAVEVTFVDRLRLPDGTECRDSGDGEWAALLTG